MRQSFDQEEFNMQSVTLGRTNITVPQNAFGALPIQRVSRETAVSLLRSAYEGGMRLFDTARAYSDSEEKVGLAFEGMRDKVYITSKTQAKTADAFWKDLETSLKMLRTDYIDVYQLHCAPRCFAPGDESGLYECMLEAKKKGMIRHIGITAHLIAVALEAADSGLYETIQFPFSYLASQKEVELVRRCAENDVGFIAMKGLAGGLITCSEAAMAYVLTCPNVLPIWGIQREKELKEWLSYFDKAPVMTDEIRAFIEKERVSLAGDFCRGCGYCMPCPQDIRINSCARMSLMVRRAPSAAWLNDFWQAEMKKIESCTECRRCASRCPYSLDTPNLLKKNYEDYKKILAGEVSV